MLGSVAEQANLSLALSETPKDTFCRVGAHYFIGTVMQWRNIYCYYP